jgi:hypothetical protein
MKRLTVSLFSLIFLLIFISGCKSTKSNHPIPPPSIRDGYDDQKCYYNGKLTKAERKSIFPFNKAFRIFVISFDSKLGKAAIANDTICYSKTKEIQVLSSAEVNKLTDILYNYNYSKKTNLFTETEVGCYYPRHSIIFLDNLDKVISYIEICLECRQIKTSLPKENIGQFCEGKYELIKEFFDSIGIKYYED